MNFAPMQITKVWIGYVSIHPSLGWQATPDMLDLPLANLSARVQRANEQPTYRLFLNVKVPHIDSESELPVGEVPYFVDIEVAAEFLFIGAPEPGPASMARMVALNGLATLYAFARDVVHQITAQAEHGPLTLPMMNVTDMGNQLLEQMLPPASSPAS